MKVAVSGASGHIGSEVCRELLRRGHEVVALIHKDTTAIDGLKLEYVHGGLLDLDSLNRFLSDCDALIHTAASIKLGYGFSSELYEVNVKGTENILNAARNCGVKRVIHMSSVHAFEHKPFDKILDEFRGFVGDDSVYYDQTKREGHKLAQVAAASGLDVVILCPAGVIGPPDFKPSHLGKAVIDIFNGSVPAVIKGGFNFVDVRDVAAAAINALKLGRSGESYILGGKYFTLKQLAELVLKSKPHSKQVTELPVWVARAALPFIRLFSKVTGKRPLYDKAYLDILQGGNPNTSSAKAENELGFRSRSLDETLADTVKWFKDNGKIN